MRFIKLAGCAIAIVSAVSTTTALAEPVWPAKTIRLIMPFGAGGPGDVRARKQAEALSKQLNTPIIVENKPGAGGLIGSDYVAKIAPDGYTFLQGGNGIITNHLLRSKMPYAEEDLIPIALTSAAPSIMVVNPANGIKNLKDLQEYAKKNGGISFADAGSGSTGHFVATIAKQSLNIPITTVHYKSGSESIVAVIGNKVTIASEAGLAVLPYISSGKLVAIAVAGDQRLAALPNVPTAKEQGFPAIRMDHWGGYFAPKGTPQPIIDKFSAAVVATTKLPQLKDEFEKLGYNPMAYDQAQSVKFLQSEKERLAKIVKENNMAVD